MFLRVISLAFNINNDFLNQLNLKILAVAINVFSAAFSSDFFFL